MRVYEKFDESNNWGEWGLMGASPVAVPDGCYWIDGGYQWWEHLEALCELDGCRLMPGRPDLPDYVEAVPWVVVRGGQAFWVGRWGADPGFLSEVQDAPDPGTAPDSDAEFFSMEVC